MGHQRPRALEASVQPSQALSEGIGSQEMSVAIITGLHNNALQLTRRVGVPASRAVVEARLAAERECYADRLTEARV